jgi:uncharacterized protein YjbI with pentapeptide repeats
MTNTPTPLDPIAQLVAKYQSNGHQIPPTQQQVAQTAPPAQQTASQLRQKKGWTGFAEKTLWDWLNLLGVLLIPLILGAGTILITAQQSAISQSQHESDLGIANNQFQEALLKTFRDDINHLVFDQHLLTAKYGDPVRIMAQSYTNDALRKLDLSRRVLLVQFLSDLHLLLSTTKTPALISLFWVQLSYADLIATHLSGTELGYADLSNAKLIFADLRGADLSGTELGYADLSNAKLIFADLRGADLSGTELGYADLSNADLRGADLREAQVAPEQLALAYFLKGAILPDGSHYPSRNYPIPNHLELTN